MDSDARNPMGTGDQAADAAALLASPMVQAAMLKVCCSRCSCGEYGTC